MAKIDYPPSIKIKQSPYGWERGYVSECGRWAFNRAPAEPGAVNPRVWYLTDAQSRLPATCHGPHPSLNEARRVAGGQETMERLGLTEEHLLAADRVGHPAGPGRLPVGVPAVKGAAPRRRRKATEPVEPKVPTSPCYRCRRSVPRHELVSQQMMRGARGRRHTGYVLMCNNCAAEQKGENRTVVIMVLVAFGLIFLLFLAFGIPLTKSLNKPH